MKIKKVISSLSNHTLRDYNNCISRFYLYFKLIDMLIPVKDKELYLKWISKLEKDPLYKYPYEVRTFAFINTQKGLHP